jgi:hypothetical protein
MFAMTEFVGNTIATAEDITQVDGVEAAFDIAGKTFDCVRPAGDVFENVDTV